MAQPKAQSRKARDHETVRKPPLLNPHKNQAAKPVPNIPESIAANASSPRRLRVAVQAVLSVLPAETICPARKPGMHQGSG